MGYYSRVSGFGDDVFEGSLKGVCRTMSSTNLAARAGRWSAEHWKTATALWIVVVVVAIVVGRAVGTHKLSMAEQSTGETARAEQILAGAGFSTPANESVLVKSSTLIASDPAFRSAVQSVMARLRTMPQVEHLRTGAAGAVLTRPNR